MAYLAMMTIRLIELRRTLKSTGSLYLHCDPVASHYLKIIMDSIFGHENFRNEVIWRRSAAHNKLSRQYGPIHDVILFYSRGRQMCFHPAHTPYTRSYISDQFRYSDARGSYRLNELTAFMHPLTVPRRKSRRSGDPFLSTRDCRRGASSPATSQRVG